MEYVLGSVLVLNLFFFVTAIVYWVNYKNVMTNRKHEIQEYNDVQYVGTDGSVGAYVLEPDYNLYIDLRNSLNYNDAKVKTVKLY